MSATAAPVPEHQQYYPQPIQKRRNVARTEGFPGSRDGVLMELYNVSSTVSRRFACTRVLAEMVNTRNESQELCFSLHLPSDAFVSGICLKVSGRKYAGVVREKAAARQMYEDYKETGVPSGLVESRGVEEFKVCLSVGAAERALFSVEYHQLLVKRLGRVRHTVSFQPSQPVPNCSYTVLLEDEVVEGSVDATRGKVEKVSSGTRVSYSPSLEDQLRENTKRGVSLDMETSFQPAEVSSGPGEGFLSEHHFLQYFSPSAGLKCLCQTFIFVLDVSGSMRGDKIEQVKNSALHLLDNLKEEDKFNILTFEYDVQLFMLNPVPVGEYRGKAKIFVDSIEAGGGTNIDLAARSAISQVCGVETECVNSVTLLSDGDPTYGEGDPLVIAKNLRNACPGTQVSFNCLSFGEDADHDLMETLAFGNGGRAVRIYEGRDAEDQLEDFLDSVLCPLLSRVEFNFPENQTQNLSVRSFPVYYRGDELLVTGARTGPGPISYQVLAHSQKGKYGFQGDITVSEARPEAQECLEGQLHAFLMIRQSMEQSKGSLEEEERAELREKMLEYALQFNFVTELTSLIVSPLVDPSLECSAPCSCVPRASPPDAPSDQDPDGIKINPEYDPSLSSDNEDSVLINHDWVPPPPYHAGGEITPYTINRGVLRPISTFIKVRWACAGSVDLSTLLNYSIDYIDPLLAPLPEFGECVNVTGCVRGTGFYVKIQCGVFSPDFQTLSCGRSYPYDCFLNLTGERPICMTSSEFYDFFNSHRYSSRVSSQCDQYQALCPVQGVSCQWLNGRCRTLTP